MYHDLSYNISIDGLPSPLFIIFWRGIRKCLQVAYLSNSFTPVKLVWVISLYLYCSRILVLISNVSCVPTSYKQRDVTLLGIHLGAWYVHVTVNNVWPKLSQFSVVAATDVASLRITCYTLLDMLCNSMKYYVSIERIMLCQVFYSLIEALGVNVLINLTLSFLV